MKRAAHIFGITLIILAGVACNDDFLERNNQEWYSLSDTLLIDNYNYEATVTFELPQKVNSDFTVFMRPKWLAVDSPRGEVSAGIVNLALSLDGNSLPGGLYSYYGTVILEIEDFGFVSFTVIYTDYGSPSIQCSPAEIVFDGIASRSFNLSSPTGGILDWTISEVPDWLTFSSTSGILYYGQNEYINVWLNTDRVTPGIEMNGTVRISSPHAQNPYMLRIKVTSAAVPPPQGFSLGSILTDAEYHHATGKLAVCTNSPNQLIIYDTYTWESDTILLDKTPACISISEDGHRAVIGYSVASVAYIDLDAFTITAEYNIDCIPYDIVLGTNGWCYITPLEDQWVEMHNLDLNTGQVTKGTNLTAVYEETQIKKVPGKPYMVGSRTTLSPTGLLLFDLTEGKVKEEVSYYHESLGHFWISKDGSRIYSANGNVYRMPEYDGIFSGASAPVYGAFGTGYSYIRALDDCPAINSVILSASEAWYQPGNSSLIEQYDATSLNRTKTFNVSPIRVNVNGTEAQYETTPRFIFVNREGTAMHVLKVLRPDYNVDGWLMETIALQ
jgi:hypothetical protein